MKSIKKILAIILYIYCLKSYAINLNIINDYKKFDIKRDVKVVLSEKVTIDELKKISLDIKSKDNKAYQRTFINYLLKNQENEGFWAKATFDPELSIEFLGVSLEKEKTIVKPKIEHMLGAWLEEFGMLKVFYFKNKRLFEAYAYLNPDEEKNAKGIKLKVKLPDEELTISTLKSGLKQIKYKDPNFSSNVSYILKNNGDLELFDTKYSFTITLKTIKNLNSLDKSHIQKPNQF